MEYITVVFRNYARWDELQVSGGMEVNRFLYPDTEERVGRQRGTSSFLCPFPSTSTLPDRVGTTSYMKLRLYLHRTVTYRSNSLAGWSAYLPDHESVCDDSASQTGDDGYTAFLLLGR
jgi:hypothetical protein